MNMARDRQAAERIEQIYRNAEIRARARQDFIREIGSEKKAPTRVGPCDNRLRVLASHELECRALRTKSLPPELTGDDGWAMLLRLFVGDGQADAIAAHQIARTANLSDATAARLLAALIGEGLVMRLSGEATGDEPVRLGLTGHGRRRVRASLIRILELRENMAGRVKA